jgi:predicted dienelactone hydrolase
MVIINILVLSNIYSGNTSFERMKTIDLIFLLATIGSGLYLVTASKHAGSILKPVIALVIVLAIVQLSIEGYYWQFIPVYCLILFLIVMGLFLKTVNNKLQKRLFRISLSFLIIASIVPWSIFLPIPTLTEPRGNYNTGTRIFRWIDIDRDEQITSNSSDKRNVIVQAWYPVEENAKGIHSIYLDGLDNLPEKIGVIPSFIFDHYDQIDSHGILDAPISKKRDQWPVVIFLTGNGAARAFYTSLVTELASYGYVVLVLDHPYEALITQLADGKIATPIEVYLKNEPNLLNFMKRRLDLRIADVEFVIDQLVGPKASDNFFSSLDQNRILIAGHSLGGATAAVAMAQDSRIKAAVNIDGTLYGDLPKPNGPHPFLLIESNKDDSDQYVRYETGNQQLFRQFEGGFRYEITEADHYSFTDAPLLLAFPTRFLASRVLGVGNIPTRTHHETVDILNTFFDDAQKSNFSDMDSISGRYPGIIRKPIE